MSEVCIKKIKQRISRNPFGADRNITSFNRTTRYVKTAEFKLLEQIDNMLSFVCAIKAASHKNQWLINDEKFLLAQLLLLQEKWSSWEYELKTNTEQSYTEHECDAKLNLYSKDTACLIANAILAVNTTNSNELRFAIDLMLNRLKLILQIFHQILEQKYILTKERI